MRFALSFGCLLFFPLFFPKLQLLFFAPYLIHTLYKKELIPALWRALFCGVLIDLFAATPHFGFTSLNYVLALLILRTQKHNFFEDKIGTLPLMCALFSMLTTFFILLEQRSCFSWRFVVTDLFEMALLDALFALLLYLPFQLRKKFRKIRL
ncbi:MAG: hypothetical protein S4CHLAM81_13210 [Chlamydiales bacterium]|nr:hypothetical protein [Chlamydiales bacterium]MCH9636093.1 hypothetical protein [Chlamydiales bacterium]MCH9703150.1 mreD [Chlamydiota bacterium]